jgi:hypothetical protein
MCILAELQERLQNHLLNDDEAIVQQLTCPFMEQLPQRLGVYAQGYRWRLIDALQKEYSLIHSYLGDEDFVTLSEAYIDAYPSRFYSVSEFTKQLPSFLMKYRSQHPYLSELARLIRALSLSLETKDASILSATVLAEVPLQNWPSLCFTFHPSVQCLSFCWNTFTFWKALVKKTVLPKLCEKSSYCIVWRKELQSYANSLSTLEFAIFQALQAGTCFADACEAVYTSGLASEAEAANWVANCVSTWLNDHWFSEVYIP